MSVLKSVVNVGGGGIRKHQEQHWREEHNNVGPEAHVVRGGEGFDGSEVERTRGPTGLQGFRR